MERWIFSEKNTMGILQKRDKGVAEMYHKLIEKLKPRPIFNTVYYKDEDLYSDGDVEDVIIKIIAENEPEKYIRAIGKNMNWPVYYHLTHLRKNILNWYPFRKDSSILEIGCGMGSITNMLCEKCQDVTAVELSKRRATATLLRCREKENLEIIVGNLNDISFKKKFDYITLIGVLEYQGTYTDTDNPYLDFLMEIKKLLKPGGKLLIGIENKYGLKYWCGAREDHTGIPFEGMNQYSITNRSVRTFSRKELEELVKDSGFQNTFFYYPMPDYKLPTVVYSQKWLPQNENMHNLAPYYIPDRTTLVADEMGMYKDIIDNGVFEFFANSFLVECSDNEDVGKVIFSCLSSERQEKYRIATVFTREGVVEKLPLSQEFGASHLQQILRNHSSLRRTGRKVLPMQMEEGRLRAQFIDGELLEHKVLDAFLRKDKLEVFRLLERVYQEILQSSDQISAEENIFFTMGIDESGNAQKYGPILKVGYLDMILRNAFYVDDEIEWFDQEWILECIPAKYILFRVIAELYISFPWVESIISLVELAERYELFFVWDDFRKMQQLFADMVGDQVHAAESQLYRGTDRDDCLKNIRKLMD